MVGVEDVAVCCEGFGLRFRAVVEDFIVVDFAEVRGVCSHPGLKSTEVKRPQSATAISCISILTEESISSAQTEYLNR